MLFGGSGAVAFAAAQGTAAPGTAAPGSSVQATAAPLADSVTWSAFQGSPAHVGVAAAGTAPVPALRPAWRWPGTTPSNATSSAAQPVVADGLAITVTERQVVALDLSTHGPRWTVQRRAGFLDAPAVDAAAGTDGIVVFTEGRSGANVALSAVDLASGTRLWRFAPTAGESGAAPGTSPMPASPVSPSGSSPSASASTGSASSPSPSGATPTQIAIRGAPVIADGMVFAGDDNGVVYALDVTNGTRVWTFRAGAPVHTSPTVSNGEIWSVAEDPRSGRATLYALDERTGKERWSYSPKSFALNATAPTADDGVVYVGFGDRLLRAFDATTHEMAWSAPVRYAFSSYNGLAASDGSVYALDAAGGLYRFDARDGDLIWDFQFDSFAVRGAPLIAQGFAYAQLDDGTVAAIDLATGDMAWSTTLRFGSAGGAAPAGDTILVSYVGRGGGLVAFHHVDAPLTAIESPTKFHPFLAVANFGLAFVVMLAGILGIFTFLKRRRDRSTEAPVDRLDESKVTP